jgi:hypothetical protein
MSLCDLLLSRLSDKCRFFFIPFSYILCIYCMYMKVSPILHFAPAVTMKTFLALVLLAALGLVVSFVSFSYIKISGGSNFIPFFQNCCMSSYHSMHHSFLTINSIMTCVRQDCKCIHTSIKITHISPYFCVSSAE